MMFTKSFDDVHSSGKFWRVLGLVTLTASAMMASDYGWGVSWMHAAFLGCLSVITAFSPDAMYREWMRGKHKTASAIAIILVPLFLVEFTSHAGYTAGLRGVNIDEASVQRTKWTDARGKVDDNQKQVKLWTEHKADLISKNAWAATVTAEGLRADLPAIDEAIRQEAARVRCGAKCLALKEKKADIESKIAVAEEISSLQKQINSTQAMIDKYRDQSSNTDFGNSAVQHQKEFLAKIITLGFKKELNPTEFVSESTNQVMNLSLALAATFLPALAFFIAGLYRVEYDGMADKTTHSVASASAGKSLVLSGDGDSSEVAVKPRSDYPAQMRRVVVKETHFSDRMSDNLKRMKNILADSLDNASVKVAAG